MNEIKCPKCGEKFKVDEASFASILKQVRDSEFEKELHERVASAEELAETKAKSSLKDDLAKKDAEIAELKNKANVAVSQKNTEIAELKVKIEATETEKKLAVTEALSQVEKERDELANKLKIKETEKELAISKAVGVVAKERDELKIKLSDQEREKQDIKNNYEARIKDRDEAIERLKDMKVKLSTKMVGESLEQFCQNEFNKIRATAFPHAYFEKDNDVVNGSKGDFIFRDPSEGVESVSIMFEMKNENETTAAKHKNEDFLTELDKDRREKNCEYAILVSMLEADSDLYNQGIVDVSYKYPKMYVVRPQFFIPMITLLKNAAEKSLAVKNELAIIKSQNIDITTFEEDVNTWKSSWLNSMKNAGKKHLEAVEQINKAIKDLEKVRDALTLSDKHLLSAENKMDDLTIKRLTRKNPTMAAKFAELQNNDKL
jgi:hypothetical protein